MNTIAPAASPLPLSLNVVTTSVPVGVGVRMGAGVGANVRGVVGSSVRGTVGPGDDDEEEGVAVGSACVGGCIDWEIRRKHEEAVFTGMTS